MNFLPHINFTNCLNLKMALKSLDKTIKKHIYCSRSFLPTIFSIRKKNPRKRRWHEGLQVWSGHAIRHARNHACRVFLAPLHLVWTKVMSSRLITEAYCLSLTTERRACENDVNKTVKPSGGLDLKWWPCFWNTAFLCWKILHLL